MDCLLYSYSKNKNCLLSFKRTIWWHIRSALYECALSNCMQWFSIFVPYVYILCFFISCIFNVSIYIFTLNM